MARLLLGPMDGKEIEPARDQRGIPVARLYFPLLPEPITDINDAPRRV